MTIKEIKVVDLNIFEINPNESQPRKKFDDESIENLAKSIEKHGIIQPILVRKVNGYYEIIAGERRWRAARKLGLKKVPAIVKEMKALEVAQVALVENIQREDLNPIEEAEAFKALIDKHCLTQEKIADLLGKSRSHVANTIRLLNLDESVKILVKENKLTSGHGRTILGLNNPEEQINLANQVIKSCLSVRETEALVRKYNNNMKVKSKTKKCNPALEDIEKRLMDNLGTKVHILSGKKKGKIEIEYYSEDELERIIELIER